MAINTEVCRECSGEAYIDTRSYPLKRPVLCFSCNFIPEVRQRFGYPVHHVQPPKGGPRR